MRRYCGCRKESGYDKLRNFMLAKLLRFFGKMENKLWRELYVLKPTKRCTCKNRDKIWKTLQREYLPNILMEICLNELYL
jgi:hypothetical protein